MKEISVNNAETMKTQMQMKWLNTMFQGIGLVLTKVISTKSRLSLEMKIRLTLPVEGEWQRCKERMNVYDGNLRD